MARFLEKIANHSGNCLIYDDKTYSYEDLRDKINEKREILHDIKQGSTIAIIGDYDIDSLSFLLCAYECKMIIAPLLASNPNEDFIKEAQIEYIYQDNQFKKTSHTSKNSLFLQLQDKSGLILFSSGSTGAPKAIVHNLDSMLEAYIDKKVKPIYMLLFLGFDHIGGLNTLFNMLSIGGCGIAIKNRKDIKGIAKALQDYKISLLPASPSLLNLILLSNVINEYDLSALRVITYGSESMPNALLTKLKKAFPKVRFHQTFGTSETGITQTKGLGEAIKLEKIDYKIINNELYLKSKTQTLGYLNSDNSVFDDEGYFATGDLVEVIESNGEQYLKIIGRSKEIINVGGEKVIPSEVEGVILNLPYILDCLVYGEKNNITGQSVGVKVVLDSRDIETKDLNNATLKKQIRIHCKDKLANYKIPTKVEIVESLAISERFKKMRNAPLARGEIGGGVNDFSYFKSKKYNICYPIWGLLCA